MSSETGQAFTLATPARRALRYLVPLAVAFAALIPTPVAAAPDPIPAPPGARVINTGQFCGTAGEIAQTSTGLAMVCITTPTDDRYRFRALDPTQTPPVGSVYRLYRAYFLREPDAGGIYYWIGQTANGTHLGAISNAFVVSNEFVSTYGALDTPSFVRFVYLNVLGREPDADGYNYWAHQVAYGGMKPAALMINFSESAEYRSDTGTV
jgi:hypothetical protein